MWDKYGKRFTGIMVWVVLWQFAAMQIGKEVLLASPLQTIKALIGLMGQSVFWYTVFYSIGRIVAGFSLAVLTGVLLAALSASFRPAEILLKPLFSAIKSVPVASFIILLLLWVRGSNLSICISFLMVLPVVYNNIYTGLVSMDKKLLEMAKVFRLSAKKKILYIYLPRLMPYFTAACTTGLGLCWKSGVAAEVIAMPPMSIGNRLYETKLYMETAQMFRWTVVIVIISFFAEKGFLWLLSKVNDKITKGFL